MHIANVTIKQTSGWVDLEQEIAKTVSGFTFESEATYYINNNGALSAWFLNTDTLPTPTGDSGLELCDNESLGVVVVTGKIYVRVFENNIGAVTNLHIEKEDEG